MEEDEIPRGIPTGWNMGLASLIIIVLFSFFGLRAKDRAKSPRWEKKCLGITSKTEV